jgi:hypothetical protein
MTTTDRQEEIIPILDLRFVDYQKPSSHTYYYNTGSDIDFSDAQINSFSWLNDYYCFMVDTIFSFMGICPSDMKNDLEH